MNTTTLPVELGVGFAEYLPSFGLLLPALTALAGIWSTSWAVSDYKAWSRIKGGFPVTPTTWAWTYYVQWKKFSRSALEQHRHLLASHVDRRSYLTKLPKRPGLQPEEIKWPLPQRQRTQIISQTMLERLEGYFQSVATLNELVFGPSIREMHTGLAIYARRASDVATEPLTRAQDMLHIHTHCGSIHINLHPRDALQAIESGWAAPFALAICGSEPGPEFQIGISCVFVYAPRDEADLVVVKQLIDAGVRFALNQLP